MNYKLLSGCFAGEVVAEDWILDIPFKDLDVDLQEAIRDWSSKKGGIGAWVISEAQTAYELYWEQEETEEPVTLKPLSEWWPVVIDHSLRYQWCRSE